MPFRIQCPHPACRKYMLVEDDMRGQTVECLLCKQPVNIEPATPPAGPPLSPGQQVRTCPQCGARMRVSESATRVRCPKCQFVF